MKHRRVLLNFTVGLLTCVAALNALAMEFSHGGATTACRDPDSCNFWIQAKGEITATTPDDFLKFISESKREKTYKTVRLSSPGGDLRSALKLGTLIRSMGLSTETDYCVSACLYVFIGGYERRLSSENTKIGTHRFYREKAIQKPTLKQFTGEDLDSTQLIMAGLMLYLKSMGVDLQLLAISADAGPSEIRWLTTNELFDLKVIYDPNKWTSWKLEVPSNSDGLVAISQTQDSSKSMQLVCDSNGDLYFHLVDNEGDANWFEQCRKELEFHPIFGMQISQNNIRITNNPATITYLLPKDTLSLKDTAVFSSDSNYSMACTDINNIYAGTKMNIQKITNLALRNCIK